MSRKGAQSLVACLAAYHSFRYRFVGSTSTNELAATLRDVADEFLVRGSTLFGVPEARALFCALASVPSLFVESRRAVCDVACFREMLPCRSLLKHVTCTDIGIDSGHTCSHWRPLDPADSKPDARFLALTAKTIDWVRAAIDRLGLRRNDSRKPPLFMLICRNTLAPVITVRLTAAS